MTFTRRLNLFLFGIGLGTILSFVFFGKSCTNMEWAPDGRVRLRMKSTLVRATAPAQRQLDSMSVSLADLRSSMDSCDVDFGASARTDDSLYYTMTGHIGARRYTFRTAALRDYTIDSTATLLWIAPLP